MALKAQPTVAEQRRYRITLGALFALMVLIEVVLRGADLRLWGSPAWRSWAFVHLSFQTWQIGGQNPLWLGQGLGMFLTHPFLHVGLLHMVSNMLAFGFLAYVLQTELSLRTVLATFFLSAIGGALLFVLLAPPLSAMTGASGALSGLAVVWALGNAPGQTTASPRQTLVLLGGIVLLILLIEVLPASRTAWQAHLGGALAGAGISIWRGVFRR